MHRSFHAVIVIVLKLINCIYFIRFIAIAAFHISKKIGHNFSECVLI